MVNSTVIPLSLPSRPPLLLLCAPRIAGLLAAPKPIDPPSAHQQRMERLAAMFEASYERLQRRLERIDAEVEAFCEEIGIRPQVITLYPKGGDQ